MNSIVSYTQVEFLNKLLVQKKVARGSAFECAAILDYLYEVSEIDKDAYANYLHIMEEISKMLFGLIRGLDK